VKGVGKTQCVLRSGPKSRHQAGGRSLLDLFREFWMWIEPSSKYTIEPLHFDLVDRAFAGVPCWLSSVNVRVRIRNATDA